MVAEQFGSGALGIADDAFPGGSHGGDFDGPVAAAKGGDGVAVGSGAGEFVSGAATTIADSARVIWEPLSAPASARKTPFQCVPLAETSLT
jgi:hypothetical protein